MLQNNSNIEEDNSNCSINMLYRIIKTRCFELIRIPGRIRFFKTSVPVAEAFMRQILLSSKAAWPRSPHNLVSKKNCLIFEIEMFINDTGTEIITPITAILRDENKN